MRKLYKEVASCINRLDFERLWPGFTRCPFALYNDETVTLADRDIPRTNAFYGNTAIQFEEDYLAIWYVKNENDISNVEALSALIVHEMFHAYQYRAKEKRFPNEIKALWYAYHEDNLTLKFEENQLIAKLIRLPNRNDYEQLSRIRTFRKQHHAKETAYEDGIETIEGMAVYVELKALKILDETAYKNKISIMTQRLECLEELFPIRAINYDSGACLLLIAEMLEHPIYHAIKETSEPISDICLLNIIDKQMTITPNDKIKQHLKDFTTHNKEKVAKVLKTYTEKVSGHFTIIGLDPMNTIRYQQHIHCQHILAYTDQNKTRYIQQECVAEIDEDTHIKTIYY